jgi:hypothetical protein
LHYIGRPKRVVQRPWLQKELDKLLSEESSYEGVRA